MGLFSNLFSKKSELTNEFIGTFLFVLIGTSALTAINVTGQATSAVTLLVGSLVFSVSLGWLVYYFSSSQLAQFNPATTLLLWLGGQLSAGKAFFAIILQFIAAILASVVVALMYGTAGVEARLGAPYPATAMGDWAALVAELLGTLVLFMAIRHAISAKQLAKSQQALVVGLGYGLGYLLASGISGGALNPARALAPQITAADLTGWWVYVAAPLAAALITGISLKQEEPAQSEQSSRVTQVEPVISPKFEQSEANEVGESAEELSGEETDLQKKAKQALERLKQATQSPKPYPLPATPSFYPSEDEPDINNLPPSPQPVIEPQQSSQTERASSRQPLPKPTKVKFVKFEGDDEDQA